MSSVCMPLANVALWTQKRYSSLLWQRRGQAAGELALMSFWCHIITSTLCYSTLTSRAADFSLQYWEKFPRLNLWDGRKCLIFSWDWLHYSILQALQWSAGQVLTLGRVQSSCPTQGTLVSMLGVAKKLEKLPLSMIPSDIQMLTLIQHPSHRKLNYL